MLNKRIQWQHEIHLVTNLSSRGDDNILCIDLIATGWTIPI
jgi:hypothetical protein